MTSREQAAAQLNKIPAESRKRKWYVSLAGIASIAIGAAMPKFLEFPWYIGAAVFGFGCFLVSKDLVIAYLRFIPAAIRDIYNAAKGS